MKSLEDEGLQGDVPVLDEEFLLRVDRAMLAGKQSDPCRLEQVARATEEQARLANLMDSRESASKGLSDFDGA